jgi:hypothetical protein
MLKATISRLLGKEKLKKRERIRVKQKGTLRNKFHSTGKNPTMDKMLLKKCAILRNHKMYHQPL